MLREAKLSVIKMILCFRVLSALLEQPEPQDQSDLNDRQVQDEQPEMLVLSDYKGIFDPNEIPVQEEWPDQID